MRHDVDDDEDDAFDANGVCKDGRGLRVPMMTRDHQPGFRSLSDTAVRDARHEARDGYVRRTCEAWRTAGHVQQDADPTKPDPSAAIAIQQQLERWQGRDLAELTEAVEARRRTAHAEFAQRLSNAWRGGR